MLIEEKTSKKVVSAPPEWNVALLNIGFDSLKNFNKFLAQVGVTAEQLRVDSITGHVQPLDGTYPAYFSLSYLRLTGFGIDLLYQATSENLSTIREALLAHSCQIKGENFDPRDEIVGSKKYSDHRNRSLAPSSSDLLEVELMVANKIGKIYPTTNLQEFKTFFNLLVADLRDGIPYSDRDPKDAITPGKLLKFYLMSFVTDEQAIRSRDNQLSDGRLSILESIGCIFDEARTKKFLSEVRSSVAKALKENTGSIEVIDAGCGGVPIQSIQAALLDPRVKVTALEFNSASAVMASQIVKALGLSDQITVIEADATKYIPEKKAHIVISETLQAGLGGEPVVQILNHLSTYLHKNGRMIPESVDVRIGFVPMSEILNPERTIRVGHLDIAAVNPSWQQSIDYRLGASIQRIVFDLKPAKPIEEPVGVYVGIELKLGGETLFHNESLITMPRIVTDGATMNEDFDGMRIDQGDPRIYVSYLPGMIPIGISK